MEISLSDSKRGVYAGASLFVLEEFTLQCTNYACACIQVVDMEAFHTSLGEATEC